MTKQKPDDPALAAKLGIDDGDARDRRIKLRETGGIERSDGSAAGERREGFRHRDRDGGRQGVSREGGLGERRAVHEDRAAPHHPALRGERRWEDEACASGRGGEGSGIVPPASDIPDTGFASDPMAALANSWLGGADDRDRLR